MKKLLTRFFCTLGIIFFLILCFLAYIWFADPWGVRPLIENLSPQSSLNESFSASSNGDQVDKNPALSPAQESALEKIGIDPAKLPTTITPEMETCFTAELGDVRVEEIKQGSTPTAVEIFKTRDCY